MFSWPDLLILILSFLDNIIHHIPYGILVRAHDDSQKPRAWAYTMSTAYDMCDAGLSKHIKQNPLHAVYDNCFTNSCK